MKHRNIALANIIILSMLVALFTACGNTGENTEIKEQAEKETESVDTKYVYLAGPFFNETEIKNIEYVENILSKKGFDFFSPMRNGVDAEEGTTEWAQKIFEMDRTEIDKADFVVAVYYGSNGDTGTAWECGYASAKGVPIILVHVEENGDSNLMMHCGCTTNVYLKDLEDYDFDTMPVYEYKGAMF